MEDPASKSRSANFDEETTATAAVMSAITSLKSIVSIVMALTMTNTLVLLVTNGNYSEIRSVGDLQPRSALFATLLIINVVRFYHGNIRHVDAVYSGRESLHPADRPSPRGGLGVDFMVILLQSLLFAVMSFYLNRPQQLLALFSGLLTFDVVWTLLVQQPSPDSLALKHQGRWMLNNVTALIALLVLYAAVRGGEENILIYGGAAIVLINAIADFIISWHFYFPTPERKYGDSIPGGQG